MYTITQLVSLIGVIVIYARNYHKNANRCCKSLWYSDRSVLGRDCI